MRFSSYRVMGGERFFEVIYFKISLYLLNILCRVVICFRYGEYKGCVYFVFILVKETSIKYSFEEIWVVLKFSLYVY